MQVAVTPAPVQTSNGQRDFSSASSSAAGRNGRNTGKKKAPITRTAGSKGRNSGSGKKNAGSEGRTTTTGSASGKKKAPKTRTASKGRNTDKNAATSTRPPVAAANNVGPGYVPKDTKSVQGCGMGGKVCLFEKCSAGRPTSGTAQSFDVFAGMAIAAGTDYMTDASYIVLPQDVSAKLLTRAGYVQELNGPIEWSFCSRTGFNGNVVKMTFCKGSVCTDSAGTPPHHAHAPHRHTLTHMAHTLSILISFNL